MNDQQSPTNTAAAIFPTRAAAEEAVSDLQTSGFAAGEIELVVHPSGGTACADAPQTSATIPAIATADIIGYGAGLNPAGAGSRMGSFAAPLAMLNLSDGATRSLQSQLHSGKACVLVRGELRNAIARTILERNGGSSIGSCS